MPSVTLSTVSLRARFHFHRALEIVVENVKHRVLAVLGAFVF